MWQCYLIVLNATWFLFPLNLQILKICQLWFHFLFIYKKNSFLRLFFINLKIILKHIPVEHWLCKVDLGKVGLSAVCEPDPELPPEDDEDVTEIIEWGLLWFNEKSRGNPGMELLNLGTAENKNEKNYFFCRPEKKQNKIGFNVLTFS